MFAQDERKERNTFPAPQNPQGGTTLFQVSDSRDGAEVNARQTADSVMGGGIFREGSGSFSPGGEAQLSNLDLAGAGESLPAGLQGQMEQAMGADFSQVRVHTGAGAARASKQISARAFTRGKDLYFNQGNYDPHSQEGQHLIAHELAHVAAGDGGIHRDPTGNQGNQENQGNQSSQGNQGSQGNQQGNQPSPEEERRNQAFQEMKDATTQGTATFQRANRTITEVGTFQSIAVAAKARGLNTGNLNQKKTDLAALKGTIAEKSTQVQQKIEAFNTAQSSLGEQSEEQKTAVQQAQQVKDQLGKANSDLDQAAQALDFGLEQSKMKDQNQQGKAFSQPVLHMLNSDAGELFMQAAAQMSKAAGGQSIQQENEAVAGSAIGQKLLETEDSGWDTAGKVAGYIGLVAGDIGDLNSFVSSGTEIDEAKKGENNVSQESKTASDVSSYIGAVMDTAGALAGSVEGVVESKQLSDQQKLRKQHIEEMKKNSAAAGKLSSWDHVANTANASSWIGNAADYVSAGNSIGELAAGEKYDEQKGNVASVVGDSLSVTGDVLGLAANSRTAQVQHQQDIRAKENMRNLGLQLKNTINGSNTGRNKTLNMICARLQGKKLNGKSGNEMMTLIDDALEGRNPEPAANQSSQQGNQQQNASQGNQQGTQQQNAPPVDYTKPELESKQKTLLLSLKMLEMGRRNSKAAASESRWDTAFDVLGTIGSLTSLAASITRMAGKKLGGAIVGLVANAIGAVGSIRDTVKTIRGEGSTAEEKEKQQRENQVFVFKGAIQQMAMLPPLSFGALQAAAKNKLNMSEETMIAAEQYAAVFASLEAANVNMVDFLYAIHKGNFGGKDEQGNARTVRQSLEDTYTAMAQ